MDRLISEQKVLDAFREYQGSISDFYKTIKAIPSAEPSGDAVSRQAVLSYIYNDLGLGDEENGADIERQKELESSYRYVKSLPPVTLQPKTGHWIEKDDFLHVCSECGQYIYSVTEHDLLEFHAFCGRCGARMVEQESEVSNG